MAKPSKFPKWATTQVEDPVSKQNNFSEPPDSKKQTGWDRLEYPPRQWLNWLFRVINQWIEWLDGNRGQLDTFNVADLPSASDRGIGHMVYVLDETGGSVPAFSDGSDWRRVTDRNIVSS